ncbi:MAG: flippase-like domain-containing protein [Fibrobacter sp.]|nr:flippase-like domain-containing protein [Fibrobacter sp.]
MKAASSNSSKSIIMIIPDFFRKYGYIRKILRVFFLAVLCLVIWQFRKEVISALKLSMSIGWGFLLLPVLFLVWNTFATKGWQALLNKQYNSKCVSFWNLFLLRIQSQAINQVLPVSGVGGEALRAFKTRVYGSLKNSTMIVAADKTIDVVADFVLAIAGILIAFSLAELTTGMVILLGAMLILLTGVIVFWKTILKNVITIIKSVHHKEILNEFLNDKVRNAAIRKSFAYHLIEHVIMMMEIYVVAKFTGIDLGIQQLLFCNAVGTLFNVLFIAVPARAGAFECSMAFAFSQIGLAASAGISVALIRRARQILVCFTGLVLFFYENKRTGINEQCEKLSAVAELP